MVKQEEFENLLKAMGIDESANKKAGEAKAKKSPVKAIDPGQKQGIKDFFRVVPTTNNAPKAV